MADNGKESGKTSETDSQEIQSLREQIDDNDLQILKLLNARARFVSQIGRIKARDDRAVYVPSREGEILKRLIKRNEGPFPNEGLRSVFREIVSASRSLERSIRIAYLGPEATFTHQAALRQFGTSADYLPRTSFGEIFDTVERGHADYGVVAVENSNEGAVSQTLDRFVTSDLTICAEVLLPISHDLLSMSGRLEDVKSVVSHPQALAQCRRWLDKNLPQVPRSEMQSTTLAAEAASKDETVAAIASSLAARMYGIRVVQSKIEDHVNNFTRFLVIGREVPPASDSDVTSLIFSIKKDEVGALSGVLEIFANHSVNLSKIESRPMKNQAWEYIFFLDLDGHVSQPSVSKALEEVAGRCNFLKVLGSYPRAG